VQFNISFRNSEETKNSPWTWQEIIKTAWEQGINFFDTAEAYSQGKSEIEMGRAIRELGLARNELVISTKVRLLWL
jgi:aryl-alcohol dehydrogenase-like predicted oxidoreductase